MVAWHSLLAASSIAWSSNLPVLPSPDQVAELSRPSSFSSSSKIELGKAVASDARAARSALAGADGQGQVAVVSIDADVLRAPASPGQALLGIGSASSPATRPINLRFGSRVIELACVAEPLDPQQGARHESYQVLNAPGGFARFSVRGEDIVGTIVLPNEVYRIASLEPTQQAVFRSSNSGQEAQRSMFARRLPPQALASTLERRHVQLERFAGIQPEFVAQSDVGRFLRIRGGKIGTISGPVTAPKLREALESLGELGNVPNGLELQVTQVAFQRNGQRVAFRQVINGIASTREGRLSGIWFEIGFVALGESRKSRYISRLSLLKAEWPTQHMLDGRNNDRLIESLRSREGRVDADFWSFRKPELRRGAHALIHYPAMMVPSLQGLIMSCAQASQPSMRSVFDPFAGSGTVLVEAMEHGLDFSGVDINPLAGLACLAKGGPYYVDAFDEKVQLLLGRIRADRKQRKPRDFGGRTKWFSSEVAQNLEKLHHHIRREPSKWARRLFWLALCRVVRAVCNSRMSTYKLHVRAGDDRSVTLNVCAEFASVVSKFQLHLREQHASLLEKHFISKGRYIGAVDVNVADTRAFLNVARTQYDLVMTSPPYGDNLTTIPYGQFSYLPLQWVDVSDIHDKVDHSLIQNTHATDTASLGGTLRGAMEKAAYVSERYRNASRFLRKIRNPNGKKRFGAFFFDLDHSIERIAELTRSDGLHAWTIANRRICGVEVPMVPLLTEMLEARGVKPIGTIVRDIHFKKMAVKNSISPTMTAETILLARKIGSGHAE